MRTNAQDRAVEAVPSSTSKRNAAADRRAGQRRILAALQHEMPEVVTAQRYVAGLFAVAGLMLLLPLIYLGLMALIAHFIYWHLIHNAYLIGTGFVGFALGYIGPALIGATVLLFMIKPLFARSTAEAVPQRLNREAEPFFFEYVEAICDAVGAPYPRSIRFECDVNASAGFRRGLFSLFLSDDLVLTVGTPLISGLTVKQLTGILAHEFGHFSQHTGLRLDFIVRTINYWLMRATFERDAWDDRLTQWSAALGWWSRAVFLLARLCIWLTRVALFGLTWVASAISHYFTRQMEYNADRYQASVVDLKIIRSMFGRLTDLSVSEQMAIGDLQRFWQEGRLPDDFAALVVSNIRHITPELRKQLRDHERQQQTGLFDTHPSYVDRLAAIRESGLVAGFRLEGDPQDYPATILFQDFGRLSRAASASYFKSVLGSAFDKKKLHSAQDLIDTREQEIAAYEALDRYFQVRLPILHPLPLDDEATVRPQDSKETAQRLKASRDRMLQLLPEYKKLLARHDAAENALFKTASAQSLLDCKLSFKPQEYGLPSSKRKVVQEKLDRARSGVSHLATRMLEFESEAGARLSAALQLLQLDAVVKRIPAGDALRSETLQLLPDALFLARLMSDLLPVRVLYRRLLVLWSTTRENEDRMRLINTLIESMSKLHHRLNEIHHSLSERMYPFDHADATMTLQRFVIPEVPDEQNLPGLIFVTQDVGERLMEMQVRMFARLAVAAEKVETALGLPALPQPKPEKAEKPSDDD